MKTTPSLFALLAMPALLAAPAGPAWAVYKCTMDTSITYQQAPCDGAMTQQIWDMNGHLTKLQMAMPAAGKPRTAERMVQADSGDAGFARRADASARKPRD